MTQFTHPYITKMEADDNPAAAQPVTAEQVLFTLRAAMSIDPSVREPAENRVKTWESDASPGFLLSLMQIVEQAIAVDEATRLLATVVAKNSVGSSWRKTLGTREWSRIPAQEKSAVRDLAFQLLLSDPSERVSVQLALLITNIARFDFPTQWENMFSQFLAAISWESPAPIPSKLRALRALKHIFKGLTNKRFIIEPPRPQALRLSGPGMGFLTQDSELTNIAEAVKVQRQVYKARLAETVEPLQREFLAHGGAYLAAAPGWDTHVLFARAAVNALGELTYLSPLGDALHPGVEQLLHSFHQISTAVSSGNPQGALDGAALSSWRETGAQLYERIAKALIGYLDNTPVPFAKFLPHFLDLYIDAAVLGTDAAGLRSMRAKRRVLMVRFIAKAMLCPYYRSEWLAAPLPAHQDERTKALVASRESATLAHDALTRLLAAPGVGPLVEALVGKYVCLAGDELEEWVADPEGYLRSADVESSPDADAPRAIGVSLLMCMLERGGEDVARALIGLAARLQQQSERGALLLREACYRCIGEGFPHVSPYIEFAQWYAAELQPHLAAAAHSFLAGADVDIVSAVLAARALWLLGHCGQELEEQQWGQAYALTVQYMGSKDLVVAHTAATAVLQLSALVLDDQALLERAALAEKQRRPMPNASESLALADLMEAVMRAEDEGATAKARARVVTRVAVLRGCIEECLGSAFALLARLTEVESKVRVLQLISVQVEAMGDAIAPFLGVLAAALPQVWSASEAVSVSGSTRDVDTGALARLHSALIAVLTHLVNRLRTAAISHPQVQSVVFPLLQYATNLRSAEAEVLVEEAFRLWAVALASLPSVPPALLQLLPNMGAILRRGRDNTAVFQILESYLLMGAAEALQPYTQDIAAALASTMMAVTQAFTNTSTKLNSEMVGEALAAAALADVMLQLYPADAPQLLEPTFRSMAALLYSDALAAHEMHPKVVNVFEGFLEVLARLILHHPPVFAALVDANVSAGGRFVSRWLSVCGAQYLEELLGVRAMAMLGRFRRRIASLALCAAISADIMPHLFGGEVAPRVCKLLAKAVSEESLFLADARELDTMDFKADLQEDHVLLRRLEVSKVDPVRAINIHTAFSAALQRLAALLGGADALLAAVTATSPAITATVQQLLAPQQQQQQQQLTA